MTTDKTLVEEWDLYRESMGSALFGEAEHLAQKMRDRIEALEAELEAEATKSFDYANENARLRSLTEWRQIETVNDSEDLKLIICRNGSVALAPGIASGPLEVTDDFDPGFIPVGWLPIPESPLPTRRG